MGVRILYNVDTWDAATVSSSSSTGDLTETNLVDDFLKRAWRSTGVSSEWIKFDLGSATNITCIGLFDFNFTSAATVTLEANATDAWGAPSYSQALTIATDSDGNVIKRLVYFLDQTYRWWRIAIADAGNADGYVEVGRVMGGAYWEPTRTVSEGVKVMYVDPSNAGNADGRQRSVQQLTPFRRASVQFRFVDATQADKLRTVYDKVGRHTPIILALDPTNRPSKDSMFCVFDSGVDTVYALADYYHQGTLMFEEKVG